MTSTSPRPFLVSLGAAAPSAPTLPVCGFTGAATGPAATAAAQAAAQKAAAQAAVTTSSAAASSTTAATAAAGAQTSAASSVAAAASGTATASSGAAATSQTVAIANTPPKAGQTPLSIAVWTIAGRSWQQIYAQKYAQQHPEIDLRIDTVVYADMSQKQLTEGASGTLQDLVYSGIKWFPFSAYKGLFRSLDDLVAQKDPGMSDFFSDAVKGATFQGKLYGLPFEVNPGNLNAIVYNQDILDKKGVTPPTDDWTLDDFAQMAVKLNDPAAKVYGTDMLVGSYYDMDTFARSLGGEVLSSDGKNFTLNTDPNAVKAAQWATDLYVKYKVIPPQAQTASIAFPAGQVALHADGVQGVIADAQAIGTKFKWGVVLGPTGPNGLRGRDGFVTMYNMSARTKSVPQAYDLLMYMTSKEQALWSMPNQGQPSARQSVWTSDPVLKVNPIFGRAAKWMADPKDQGPFPMPANLRFQELQDKFANLSLGMFYGQTPFATAMNQIQQACQAIVQESLP